MINAKEQIAEQIKADPTFWRTAIIPAIAESKIPIRDFLTSYGEAVGYEPTGMYSNKIRDAQARRDKAFKLIAEWDEANEHFTEADIPDWIRDSRPDRFAEMMDEMRENTRTRGWVFLNGVLHFNGNGLGWISHYLWWRSIITRKEAEAWEGQLWDEKGIVVTVIRRHGGEKREAKKQTSRSGRAFLEGDSR